MELKNFINIGMDGPSVNLKFHKDVEEELATHGDGGLVSVGSCPIHIANNGYNKLLDTLQEFIHLDKFASDLHVFFSKSAARRIEYSSSETITEVSSKFMLKH